MKLLELHCDYVKYKPLKKALKSAPELSAAEKEGGKYEDCLVIFASFEKGDTDEVAAQAALEVKKNFGEVKAKTVLVYPYAHLSSDLASPDDATRLLNKFHAEVRKFCPEAGKSVFGYYKEFELKCKGHPLAELSKSIRAADVEGLGGREVKLKECVEEMVVSDSLKAEEKVKPRYYILSPDGSLVPAKEFNYSKNKDLAKFAGYETSKNRCYAQEPPHIALMKEHGIADYEPASDSGNLRWMPNGVLIKKSLEDAINGVCVDYGAMQVETPIMYDFEHPALKSYLNRFPARQYVVQSDEKKYFLRFAACFGQFLLNHDMVISYKNLPLKTYELTHYSFRREQHGELCGLKRLRAFTMPDMHTLCRDLDEAKQEFERQYQLCVQWNAELGLPFETAFRCQTQFFEENKEFYLGMVRKTNKPVLLELFDERYAYFVTKFEFNFLDCADKASALSTVQIDVENAERYDLWYTDKDGSKRRPVILHASLSGGIDRVVYALLEKQAAVSAAKGTPMLPVWLSPTQIRLIPISANQNEYCEAALKEMLELGVRADFDDREETLQKKIRDAAKDWIPFVAVVGKREVESGNLSVTLRASNTKQDLTPVALARLTLNECRNKPLLKLSLDSRLSRRPVI